MSTEDKVKIALVGNTNIGKTTLFNKLCGLNQRTGNYPGVTVDKKKGFLKFGNSDDSKKIEVIDLPGLNSLFPSSQDEELVVRDLLDITSSTGLCIIAISTLFAWIVWTSAATKTGFIKHFSDINLATGLNLSIMTSEPS